MNPDGSYTQSELQEELQNFFYGPDWDPEAVKADPELMDQVKLLFSLGYVSQDIMQQLE